LTLGLTAYQGLSQSTVEKLRTSPDRPFGFLKCNLAWRHMIPANIAANMAIHERIVIPLRPGVLSNGYE
jgi:hypothetical protein